MSRKPPRGYYSVKDTLGREIRREPAPESALSFWASHRVVADKYHAINEMMQGPNPLTEEEVAILLGKKTVHDE